MNANILSIPRLCVDPRFPSFKSYLRSYELGLINWETEDLARLERYAREGSFLFQYHPESFEQTYIVHHADSDLTRISNALRWHAVHGALKGASDWLSLWRRSVAYRYWALRMEFRTQNWVLAEFESGKRPAYEGFLSLQDVGSCIGNCLGLGWMGWAIELARGAFAGMDINGFPDLDEQYGRRYRTQHFVLRLVANWQGWPERNSPQYAYDEPLFNALIEHWRSEDLETVEYLLLAACDRHTHQARQDTTKGEFFDLAGGSVKDWYVPFEILSVLRLRQTLGLPNPELDHPLMNTPLGKLIEPSEPYTDDLLQGVLARACAEFPELCEGTSIQAASSSTPAPQKSGFTTWLDKLRGK